MVNNVLYAAVPRNAPGVPATLVFVENVTQIWNVNPAFTPFSDYSVNELKECDLKMPRFRKRPSNRRSKDERNHQVDYSYDDRFDTVTGSPSPRNRSPIYCDSMERLISVYEPVMDKCGRLWIIDTGVLEYSSGDVVLKRPQLWTFDVKQGPWNSKLIRRFDFAKDVLKDGTGLTGLTVDILNGNCEDTFVYIPNHVDNRIVVYDFFKDDAWYFEHYSFAGDSAESDFIHSGFASKFIGGISTIALGPKERRSRGYYRTLYYTAASSTGEYSMSTRELRSKKNSPNVRNVKLVGYRGKDSQSMSQVFDEENNVLFFAESQTGRIRCWNINNPLRPGNIGTVFKSPNFIYGSKIFVRLRSSLPSILHNLTITILLFSARPFRAVMVHFQSIPVIQGWCLRLLQEQHKAVQN